jgi:AcrR family transcriptional regulator
VSPGGRPTLTTPDAWAQAALDEIEVAGVRALSVQSVARRLGVSKGGLYHHFSGRRALLQAALARWEDRQVTDLATRFDAIADPRERLHELLVYAGVGIQPTIILQWMAAADDPDVAAVLERAAAARLALLRRIFVQLGAPRAAAEHRAVMAYSHYLGLAQLRAQNPDVLSTPARVRAQLRLLEAGLLTDIDG